MRVLKKYANRRLYDTENSCYITLDDVHALVLKFESVQVIEASSGDDITDQILLQIIANLENNKSHKQLFTHNTLNQLIRVYSYDNSPALSHFLEQSLACFLNPVNKSIPPMDMWMNVGRQQLDAWQKMFGFPSDQQPPQSSQSPEHPPQSPEQPPQSPEQPPQSPEQPPQSPEQPPQSPEQP